MTYKEAITILGIPDDSGLDLIKHTYRKLAFSLHPDLNPNLPNAAKKFQHLNEAYVFLCDNFNLSSRSSSSKFTGGFNQGHEASDKYKQEAGKAYSKASSEEQSTGKPKFDRRKKSKSQEEVLQSILKDPFARKVFEDIYNSSKSSSTSNSTNSEEFESKPSYTKVNSSRPKVSYKSSSSISSDGVFYKVKKWLKKQIDEEQVLRLPGDYLVPGARVRLHIQHGLTKDPETIELILPPEFVPGKVVRVKGMGKRIGKLAGDLYVRIEAE